MPQTVFYSWQSDLPNPTNRSFLGDALERAVVSLRQELPRDGLELDQATRESTGAPDIPATLFEKVGRASALVADVSLVHDDTVKRRSPNPNVLLEVGWGAARLGWDRVVLCVNEHFGRVEQLPFDLRHRRSLVYRLEPGVPDKATARIDVERRLKASLGDILVGAPRKHAQTLARIVAAGNPGLFEALSKQRAASVQLTPDQMLQVQGLLASTSLASLVSFESNGNQIWNDDRGPTNGFMMKVLDEFLELLSTA